MAQLRSPNFWRAASEKSCAATGGGPPLGHGSGVSVSVVETKTHSSRERHAIWDAPGPLVLLLLQRFNSRLRLRLGALSRSGFSGYLVAKHSKRRLFFPKIKTSVSVFPPLFGRLAGLWRSQLWSYLLAAYRRCRCVGVGHGSVCVGHCAVCELTPKRRFSPLLSAATRMYHHVTVQWTVLRLQCEHPDLTSHHIISLSLPRRLVRDGLSY